MHIPEIVYLYKGYNDHCVATEMMWGGGWGVRRVTWLLSVRFLVVEQGVGIKLLFFFLFCFFPVSNCSSITGNCGYCVCFFVSCLPSLSPVHLTRCY